MAKGDRGFAPQTNPNPNSGYGMPSIATTPGLSSSGQMMRFPMAPTSPFKFAQPSTQSQPSAQTQSQPSQPSQPMNEPTPIIPGLARNMSERGHV